MVANLLVNRGPQSKKLGAFIFPLGNLLGISANIRVYYSRSVTMNISDLIKFLDDFKKEHGDLPVCWFDPTRMSRGNPYGNFVTMIMMFDEMKALVFFNETDAKTFAGDKLKKLLREHQ